MDDFENAVVCCLGYDGILDWHFGEMDSCQATMAEAIALAKEVNDMHGLAAILCYAALLGYCKRNPVEAERLASDVIELSTRHHFVHWLVWGSIYRGWARSASGNTKEGISWIEDGIRDYRATGGIISLPLALGMKAEALHLADRTSEALEAIKEAQAIAARSGEGYSCAELHRLRGVFLAAMGAEETQIEASFGEAIRVAKEQKSVSLEKRAEATYAEYRRQKGGVTGQHGIRLPLCA